MTLERIPYGGWTEVLRLSNGALELLVTTEVGPRVLRCALAGGPNLFREFEAQLGQTGGERFQLYGGHRFWCAPEDRQRTYYPDNAPVEVIEEGCVVNHPATTETTGVRKELHLALHPEAPQVVVTHRLVNAGTKPLELAPWALSVMAPGGVAVLPLPPRGTHPEALLPSSTLTLWPYTDLADARWSWGQRFVLLRQDPGARSPQKIGAYTPDGWAAYVVHGAAFVKRFPVTPGARYPDLNCTAEVFTNASMLELESLAPLVRLEPGAAVSHVERWQLEPEVPTPRHEDDITAHLLPRLGADA